MWGEGAGRPPRTLPLVGGHQVMAGVRECGRCGGVEFWVTISLLSPWKLVGCGERRHEGVGCRQAAAGAAFGR